MGWNVSKLYGCWCNCCFQGYPPQSHSLWISSYNLIIDFFLLYSYCHWWGVFLTSNESEWPQHLAQIIQEVRGGVQRMMKKQLEKLFAGGMTISALSPLSCITSWCSQVVYVFRSNFNSREIALTAWLYTCVCHRFHKFGNNQWMDV